MGCDRVAGPKELQCGEKGQGDRKRWEEFAEAIANSLPSAFLF